MPIRCVIATFITAIICNSNPGIRQLTSDVFNLCTEYGTNQDQNEWRLICRRVNEEYEYMNKRSMRKMENFMKFMNNIHYAPMNISVSVNFMTMIIPIKLNERYIQKLPRILYRGCLAVNRKDKSEEKCSADRRKMNQILRILFDTPYYTVGPKLLESMDTHTMNMLQTLAMTSRAIMNTALKESTGLMSSDLDCFTFLYGFFWHQIHKQNNSLLPPLYDLYYLERNQDIPFKHKQLSFVREIMDQFGLIPYHHTFIVRDWSHTDFLHYVNFPMNAVSKHFIPFYNESLVHEFYSEFLIKMLEGRNYDLTHFLHANFMHMLEHSLWHLFAQKPGIKVTDQLVLLLTRLSLNNGLVIIKSANNIIPRILTSHPNAADCFGLLQILVTVNLKHTFTERQVLILADSLTWWFVLKNQPMAITQCVNFLKDEFFNRDLLNELVSIHDVYYFGDDHSDYFVTCFAELWKGKDAWKHWNYDKKVLNFCVSHVDQFAAKKVRINITDKWQKDNTNTAAEADDRDVEL